MEGILAYQRPGKNRIEAFYGKWESISLNALEEVKEGFVFVDFLQENSFVFIADTTIDWNTEAILFNSISENYDHQKALTKNEYLDVCSAFINRCKLSTHHSGDIQKLVLSRIKKSKLPHGFRVQDYFSKICKAYHHSFNYFIHIPEITTWIGATPEELIVEHKNYYSTVSLAGTRSISDSNPFEAKEMEEQSIVTDYISEVLTQSGATFAVSEKAKIVTAGNLKHLKTTFTIQKNKSVFELAKIIHPTPAICGFPKEKAKQFILENEGCNRKFYSGYLGKIDTNESYLYVNLRCAEIFSTHLNIHVGGGITALSIAEKEWDETENKSQTLLKFIL